MAHDGKTIADEMSDGIPRRDAVDSSKLGRGTSVDRYVILYELGVGGMGVVYAAYDPELDRKVAVKLLHSGSKSERARNRLMREAKAIARLTHPNVVTVHDVGAYEGRVFVAMEYVDGVTLRQWVHKQTRTWKEIVDVLRAAGEGLAAAHAADLIHRDFKPDNVLVDGTGRVIVLDFGLARRTTTTDERDEEEPELKDVSSDNIDELSLELTREGAKLGTPAYMAPEQHLSAATDQRTDQFSFCVVLWEALYGERPFKGESQQTTAVHVVRGELREPPRGVGVPTWVRAVLEKGLSTNPNDRYPSMRVLLTELARNPERERRRWYYVGGAVALVAAGAGTAWVMGLGHETDPCPSPADRWKGVWDAGRAGDLQTAFEGTGTSFAVTAARGVQSVLDGYVAEWVDVYRDACEATHKDHEQSQETMDLRMACLRERRSETAALVDEFLDADVGVVEHAVEAVSSLPRISACNDVETLSARLRPPADEFTRARVQELRDDLYDAWAKESAARYDQALAIIEIVLAGAREIGYSPLLAEALLRRGSTQERQGEYDAAERSLLEAIWAARPVGHDEVEAQAWVQLVWVTGVEKMDVEQGELWAGFAGAALQRVGRDEVLAATLTHNVAGVRYRQRRLDEALAGYRSALTSLQRVLGADDPRVAMTLNHIGNTLMEQGQFASAQEYCERSLEARRRILGSEHPKVAASLNNLAEVARKQGNAGDAEKHALDSLEIVAGTGGPEEEVALVIVGWAQQQLNKPAEAIATYERLAALRQAGEDPTGPGLTGVWRQLAALHHAERRYEVAASLLTRAVEVDRPVRPAAAVDGLLALCAAQAAMHDAAAARASLADATAVVAAHKLVDPDLLDRLERQRDRLQAG